MPAPSNLPNNYDQPELPARTRGWAINCIDLQIVTKSDGWNQDQTKRLAEFDALKKAGAEYVALAVPYDNLTKYTNYVTDARSKGLKIWHRSHWNAWEGDNGAGPTMTRQEYLDATYDFIVAHPSLFA